MPYCPCTHASQHYAMTCLVVPSTRSDALQVARLWRRVWVVNLELRGPLWHVSLVRTLVIDYQAVSSRNASSADRGDGSESFGLQSMVARQRSVPSPMPPNASPSRGRSLAGRSIAQVRPPSTSCYRDELTDTKTGTSDKGWNVMRFQWPAAAQTLRHDGNANETRVHWALSPKRGIASEGDNR